MAKLSAHGQEIGRIDFTVYRLAFMSDGHILKNHMGEWKLHKKVKPGESIADVYAKSVERQKAYLYVRPCLTAYRKRLHNLAGMGKAWKLHACVELMYDDPDGVWSEACDGYGDNIHADIDEVSDLCAMYRAAIAEQRQLADNNAVAA